ncbi:hypothetical protein EHQ64_14435 [Leptospira sarikeiensis]|uniref:Uncharacterized protein n=1 Tax=Leptospira sarikeiensis TaxID=2484943 RepID=A0A4R9K771_9LEPT|nr:hypothetical protein EHQ64_14435 [Leptospira sarikeiensis]
MATLLINFAVFGQGNTPNQKPTKNPPPQNQQNQNTAPIQNTNNQNSSSSSDSGATYSGLLTILELDAVSGGLQKGGPQSVNGILNSVRLANSVLGDAPEFFKENTSTTPEGGFTPKIRLSQQLSDNTFIGINYSAGEKSLTKTTTTSTNNRYTEDSIKPVTNEWKIRYGWGPLNLLTRNDFSYEFSIGYGRSSTTGNYNNIGIKLPGFSEGASDDKSGYALSSGQLKYNITNFSIDYGIAVPIWERLNWYFRGDFNMFWGNISMAAFQTGVDTGGTAGSYSPIQGTIFKSKDGFFEGLSGFSLSFETGFIIRIFNTFGIRVGGFYQLSTFSVGGVQGFNIAPGSTPVEIGSVDNLASTLDNKQFGNYGGSFGLVKNF